VTEHQPQLVLLSVPFPGSVYAALRMGQAIKAADPGVKIALGGGYVNTELRELKEPRLFDFVDYVTLDAGREPVLSLIEHLRGERGPQRLQRSFVRENGAVKYVNLAEPDIPFEDVGTPTWDGLPIHHYLSLLDMLNPMHRLWSDGRWNKLTVAHGCYWKKCSFCDVGLDYIGRYETATASTLADRIERIVEETGQTGFHFVDEAAPPKALKALAEELIRRDLHQLVGQHPLRENLHARAERAAGAKRLHRHERRAGSGQRPAAHADEEGCVGRTGGARDQGLHRRRHPGARLPDVRLPHADAAGHGGCTGIRAPAVRERLHPERLLPPLQLHRALAGRHEPGRIRHRTHPAARGHVRQKRHRLHRPHPWPGVDHDLLGQGLRKAIYNYMHGLCVEDDVRRWFEHLPCPVPRPTVKRGKIARALAQPS
jgi:hypothetical protein